jgi:hypothetical protein
VPVPIVLAHGTSPAQIALFKRLGAIGCELKLVQGADEGVALLTEGRGEALLLHVGDESRAAIDRLSPAIQNKVVLLAESMTAEKLRTLGSLKVGTLLAKNGEFTAEEILGAVLKHLKSDLFGIEKYLAWGTQIRRLQLTESTHRGQVLDELEQFLQQLGLDPRLIGQTLTMADELVTNAFYNAPVDETGRRRYSHLSRIEPVTCSPEHPIELSWACDGVTFAVGVSDRYGTLEPAQIVAQIVNALAGQASVDLQSAGAGIGLITAFNAASQLVFNLDERRQAQCIGLLEIGSYKRFLAQGKSVHVFQLFNSKGTAA